MLFTFPQVLSIFYFIVRSLLCLFCRQLCYPVFASNYLHLVIYFKWLFAFSSSSDLSHILFSLKSPPSESLCTISYGSSFTIILLYLMYILFLIFLASFSNCNLQIVKYWTDYSIIIVFYVVPFFMNWPSFFILVYPFRFLVFNIVSPFCFFNLLLTPFPFLSLFFLLLKFVYFFPQILDFQLFLFLNILNFFHLIFVFNFFPLVFHVLFQTFLLLFLKLPFNYVSNFIQHFFRISYFYLWSDLVILYIKFYYNVETYFFLNHHFFHF